MNEQQQPFSVILGKKLQTPKFPVATTEVHSVDEMINPEFARVFGQESVSQKQRGLAIYGVA